MSIAPSQAQPLSAPLILFVDDEEEILPQYQELLEYEGLQSMICAHPERATQLVLDQPGIRLVITDLRMAGLDGASLIRQLRAALPHGRTVDFIILTGDAATRIGDDIADVPLFIKPPNIDELLCAVHASLNRMR